MSKKSHPEKVHPQMARKSLELATERNGVYTQYIKLHYNQTGSLSAGCDAGDLIEWLKQNENDKYNALEKKKE